MGVTRVVCFAFQMVLLATTLFGQQAGNRLLLETGGPVGTIHSLRFSPDSRRLYAAGIDKQVHVWNLKDHANELSPKHTQYLRWEVSRADRGCIYAMDICPQGRRLAFGGYSSRGNSGDIVVYDPSTRNLNVVLPKSRSDDENRQEAKGHLAPIIAVSFAPGGKLLASMGIDGVTRVWGTMEQNRVLRTLKLASNNQTAAFLDDNHVAVAMPVSWQEIKPPLSLETANEIRYGTWRVVIFDALSGKVRRTTETNHKLGVTAIARDPFENGRWASADGEGRIFVWDSIDDKNPIQIDLWNHLIKTAEVRSLQFGPDGQLLASTAGYRDRTQLRSAKLVLLDVKRDGLVVRDATVVNKTEFAHTCALSPDGKLAAVFSDDAHEVWLYSLNSDKPQLNPLDKANRIALYSQGRWFQKVAFAKSKRSTITLSSTESGDFDFGFDFSTSKILRGDQVPEPHAPASDGWKLIARDDDSKLTMSHQASGKSWQLILDRVGQGPMESHCWLHDETGRVYGIVIGTAQQNGIFAYRFEAEGKCRLLRYYRDHRGPIAAMSVSRDGAYLVSSSLDQTVKVWSLRGLEENDAQSPNAPGWGGKFQIRGGELIVTDLDENGILAQREFNDGDVIARIGYRQEGSLKTAASAEEMLQFLRDRELWNPLSFAIPCRGKEEVEIYAGWQPVQTLFVGLDDSWAVWTPQGYYDASAIGDEFFGWVHNRGRDQTPGFYRAEHLRSKLEKTDVIRELLVAGQLSKAFERAGMDLPINYHNPVPNLLRNAPLVRILEPIDGADLKDQQSISVVAEVLYAAPQDFQNFQLKAYVNQSAGSLLKTRRMTDSNVFQYSFKIKPTDPTAVVQVKLFDANMPPGKNLSHDDRLVVDASSRIGELEVHFVGIGGSDYPGSHFDLSGCEDVEAFRRQLNILRPKSNYQLGEQLKFFENRVTQQNIKDSRKQLANKIQPDQLLIVFLAGHGDLDSYGFYFIPAVSAIKDIAKINNLEIKKHCIRSDELSGLATLNCRRLFIVDACNAGRLGTDLELKDLVRRWRNENIAVWCAALAGQDAKQMFANGRTMGRFTNALIEAINGGADSGKKDGYVTLRETEAYMETAFSSYETSYQKPKLYKWPGASSLLDLQLFKKN